MPLGEGFLCVAGAVTRLGPHRRSDGAGRLARRLDFDLPPLVSGPGQVVAGSTHNFQLLFRDAAGGPIGINLTDGLQVTFCP